jgi:UrcA family protein
MKSIVNRLTDQRRTLALLGILAACGIAASGSALAADALPAEKVVYGDLNLADQQGNSELYRRIASAARQVCFAGGVDIRDLARYQAARACEAQAIAAAVEAVHSPKLAAIYASHQPQG